MLASASSSRGGRPYQRLPSAAVKLSNRLRHLGHSFRSHGKSGQLQAGTGGQLPSGIGGQLRSGLDGQLTPEYAKTSRRYSNGSMSRRLSRCRHTRQDGCSPTAAVTSEERPVSPSDLFNLLSEFQRVIGLATYRSQPATLCVQMFLCGALLGHARHKTVLHCISLGFGRFAETHPLVG